MTAWLKLRILVLLTLLGSAGGAWSADTLKWNVAADRVDATINGWTVPELLEQVATATGWQIFLDPEITNRIPAKFTDKPPGEALRRLLGEYNYALVPATGSPARLFVFRKSREQATRAIQPVVAKKTAKGRIPNELIVTLKPGEKIEDIAKRLGAKVMGRSEGQDTYRLRLEDEKATQTARADLQTDPAVESIDNNYTVSRPDATQALGTPGGPLPLRPQASPDGKYTVIGLIDSAVQPKDGNFADFVLPGISVQGDGTASASGPTHGTSMSETILRALSAGSADGLTTVRILPVDVYGANAATTTYDIAVGIYKAVNAGAMIVNLSLGGEGDSTYLHDTIRSAHDQGVLFIGAAGNEPVTTATYPAAYPEVIAVTASDASGALAPYANRGDFIDVMAPGGSLITFRGQQFFVTGTSAATAFVTGRAAGQVERTGRTPAAVEAVIRQSRSPKN